MGFTIGSFFVPYYGFFIALGLLIASLAGVYQVKLFKKDVNDFILMAAIAGLGGAVGAKILYLIVSWRELDLSKIMDWAYFNSLMRGGFVFYGGLIGGAAALLLCRKRLFRELAPCLGVCIPCLPIAHGFGRLGCYAVGCCYGVPMDFIFSVVYHKSPFAPNGIGLFPVQLAEALGNFMIAAILLVYIDVLRREHGLFLYALLYASLRFFLEFFRYDNVRGRLGPMSSSQWISLLILLAATSCFLFQKKRTGSRQVQHQKIVKGRK